jgi:hypothetical protein
MALYSPRWEDGGYTTRKHSRVCPKRKGMAMGTRRQWVGALVILAVLLWTSVVPEYTDRGGHGYRGHGHKGHGHGGSRVFISPHIVVPFGAYWRPYWEPYGYPPVVIAPSPHAYAQASPPAQLPPSTGITATPPKPTTCMSNSAQGDGARWPPRRHKPEATNPRAHHPARVFSVPSCNRRP